MFEGANRNNFIWQVRNGFELSGEAPPPPLPGMRGWHKTLNEEISSRPPSSVYYYYPLYVGDRSLSVRGLDDTNGVQSDKIIDSLQYNTRF